MKTRPTKLFGLLNFTVFLFISISTNSLTAQNIDWDAVKDRYVEKYQPEEIPDWLFPIIFKDSTGAMDTIFFGYDEEASIFIKTDTVFGELFFPADSLVFNAFWGGDCNTCDTFSVSDVNITGEDANFWNDIEFINGLLPVTMYFDASFLEDPVLPFPDLPLTSDVQMDVAYTGPLAPYTSDFSWFCNNEKAAITDSTHTNPQIENCTFTDSMVFTSQANFLIWIDYLSISLQPWSGLIQGNSISELEAPFDIYPNPIDQHLFIVSEIPISGQLSLVDLNGTPVHSEILQSSNNIEVSTSDLSTGIYILLIETEDFSLAEKVVIVH